MSGKIIGMILSFPFKQLGEVLRKLSLSSDVGNIGAWILYVAICSIPAVIFAVKMVKKKSKAEDWLLPVVSVALFYVMYVMINPSMAFRTNYLIEGYMGYEVFGGIIYSTILGYMVLKLVRRFRSAEQKKMCKWLVVLLGVVNVALVLNIIVGFWGIFDTIKGINESNYNDFADIYEIMYEDMNEGMPQDLYKAIEDNAELVGDFGMMEYEYQGPDVEALVRITEIFLILRYIVSIIPSITAFIVIIMVQRFLKEYAKSDVSEETICCGNKVSDIAIKAAVINVLTNVGFNILQLFSFKSLLNIYTSVDLPLTLLIFILAMPLITKLIITSKEIKDENEMFV